jgi:uncharacterized protein YecE (DUF72 family)
VEIERPSALHKATSAEMAMSKGRIRIGTSGWNYNHWLGTFYPKGTRQRDLLAAYAERFETVEINRTFYSLPGTDAVAKWHAQSPAGFLFAVKASRYLTHRKRLKEPEEPVERLLGRIEPLKEKLGPVLFQLPPRWRVNPGRLERLLDELPGNHRYAFEFRDPSWHDEQILRLLSGKNAAFCIFDLAGKRSPIELTAGFVYIRLHGPGGAYQGSYHGRTLSVWARRMVEWRDAGKDVYCYFDNDEKAYAPHDASRLKEMVGR